MYNSVKCKNSGDIVCFLDVEQIHKGYTCIMIGLQDTFIEGWGPDWNTNNNRKHWREVDKKEDDERVGWTEDI